MEFKDLERKFKALSCEQRLRLLFLLKEWEGIDDCCDGVRKAFTRAMKELNISRSTLSHHFSELENAGLIICERNGQAVECKVDERSFDEIRAFLGDKKSGCCSG